MEIFCTHIQLNNFKSHENASFFFDKKINCIVGNNGVGKTNLLDAIYYSCMAKSYFVHAEQWVLKSGTDFFKIKTLFNADNHEKEIQFLWSPLGKKELYINQVRQERLSDLVGKFPIVFFSPNDSQLIYGSSEERRKFMDVTLCQMDRMYLEDLIKYNKIIMQRNAMLKKMAQQSNTDIVLLDIYNNTLDTLADSIHKKRNIWLKEFIQHFKTYYYRVGELIEDVEIIYRSELSEHSLMIWFEKLKDVEYQAGRTLRGIHHDDLDFEIKKMPLKKSGSQGQQKSFLLALKMAQYAMLKDKKKCTPIFIFDDIFDKFDTQRMERIFALLQEDDMGQIFITDTDKNRILPLLERYFYTYTLINIE